MVRCTKCEQEGHTRAKCPEVFCGGCRQKGHRPNTCPNRPSWKCLSCGGIGHAQWECTTPPEQILCTRCNERGHSSNKCKNKTKWFCKFCGPGAGHGTWQCSGNKTSNKAESKAPPPQPICSTCGGQHENKSCPAPSFQDRTFKRTPDTDKTSSSVPPKPSASKTKQNFNHPEPEPPKKQKPVPSDKVVKLVAIGDRWVSVKNYGMALPFFTEALAIETRIGSIYAKRGIVHSVLMRDREAISDLSSAAKDDFYVASVEFHIQSARSRLRLGSLTAAMHALRDARSLNPHHPEVQTLQSRLEDLERFRARYESTSGANNWRAAKVSYESCLGIYKLESCKVPVDVQRWSIEIMITEVTQLEEAEGEVQKLLEKDQPSEIMFLSALISFLRDMLPDCLSQLKEILTSDPDYSEAQRLRTCVKRLISTRDKAEACSSKKSWLDAREEYTVALGAVGPYERRASGGVLRANLSRARATVLYEMAQYEEAVKDVNVCLSILPEDFEALYLRGRLFIRLELYDSAVADLAAAMEQAPPHMERTIQLQLKAVEFKRKQSKDFYKILGLTPSCTRVDIKKAYRVESLKHHPDKGGLPERFSAVAEAYETLTDETKRAAYDSSRNNSYSPEFGY